MLLDESKPGERAFRCREGTEDAFLTRWGGGAPVRVEYLESVVSLIRADDALRRAFRRDPAPVALRAMSGRRPAALTQDDDSDPWRAATDAAGRKIFLPRGDARNAVDTARPDCADWISDTVLSAVADARAPAPAPRQDRDTTISLIHGPPGTGKTKELASLLLSSKKGRALACAPSNRAVIELLDRFRALGRRRAVVVGVGQVETHVATSRAGARGPVTPRGSARFCSVPWQRQAGPTCARSWARGSCWSWMRRAKRLSPTCYPPQKRRKRAAASSAEIPCSCRRRSSRRPASRPGLRRRRRWSACSKSATRASRCDSSTSSGGCTPPLAPFRTRRITAGACATRRVGNAARPDWLPYSITKNASPLKSRTVVDVTHGIARHDGPSLRNDAEVDAIDAILSTLFQRLPVRASVDVAVISFYKAQIQSLERALAPTKQRLGGDRACVSALWTPSKAQRPTWL